MDAHPRRESDSFVFFYQVPVVIHRPHHRQLCALVVDSELFIEWLVVRVAVVAIVAIVFSFSHSMKERCVSCTNTSWTVFHTSFVPV